MKPPKSPSNARLAARLCGPLLLLGLLAAGTVFSAEEKPDAAPADVPAAAAPQTAKGTEEVAGELPAWARGWVVASVTIPSDGELKDADADFQMPDGQSVTLTAGASAKGGVVLESIVWEGTPVRAHLRLRQGGESANLFAAAALIAKSKVQKKRPGLIQIEARFIEVPEALALTLKGPGDRFLFHTPAKGEQPMPNGSIATMFTAEQLPAFLAKMEKAKGADVLSTPNVVTKTGQRAVIEIIRELRYATEWKEDAEKKGAWLPTAFETRNVGITLEVEPTISKEGALDLQLIPQVVEHLGWADVETGEPIKSLPSAAKTPGAGARNILQPVSPAAVDAKLFNAGARTGILQPASSGSRRIRPVFSARKVTTTVSIFSGNSVVISDIGETEDTKPFQPKTPGRRLIVIITARTLAE